MEDLGKALTAAKILGCDKVRVFTGSRTADPKSTYPRIVEVFTPMVEEAAKHKIHLLVENEGSQNIATSAELGEFMPMLKNPWFGYNWDPNNAHTAKEIPFPDGYKKLPIDRMMNAQVKARDLLPDYPADNLPWHDIMEAMQKDGYKGHIGLETHIFDGTLIPKANLAMKEILRIVDSLIKCPRDLRLRLLIGLLVVGVFIGSVLYKQKGAHLDPKGSILKVRTLKLDENSSAAILEVRLTNDADYELVVRTVEMAVVTGKGETQGNVVAEMDVKSLFQELPDFGRAVQSNFEGSRQDASALYDRP